MRTKVYSNKTPNLCYGCGACEQICPKEAISMHENPEGFLYPLIEPDKCIDCGMCIKVCPTQNANRDRILHTKQNEIFAAWNRNLEERLKSTSGGLFYLIARYFIKENGIIYGVDFDERMLAHHKRIFSIEELDGIRGSKYMQSDTNSTFKQVKEDLNNGLKVLYSGTPCQIAGLRLFLLKDYEYLYTIDLVCHGVPSPQLFRKNIENIEQKEMSTVLNYKFRDKKENSWIPFVSYTLANGIKRRNSVSGYFYGRSFYNSWGNRESCYLCEYSCAQRCGDITLSDFWGAEKYHRKLRKVRKHGFNMVMCNSSKGEMLFQHIMPEINYFKSNLYIAQNGDPRLCGAGTRPVQRNNIYRLCKEKGYHYLAEKYKCRPNLLQRMIPKWLKNAIKEIQSYL